jgi:hypothetical protein
MNEGQHGYGGGGNTPYTVEQALHLMKTVPTEGMPERVVVQVVRTTLESVGISIQDLLAAASRRQDEVTNEIVRIQGEIASLHQAIEEKSAQVAYYQEQLGEIGSLRERFED